MIEAIFAGMHAAPAFEPLMTAALELPAALVAHNAVLNTVVLHDQVNEITTGLSDPVMQREAGVTRETLHGATVAPANVRKTGFEGPQPTAFAATRPAPGTSYGRPKPNGFDA